MKLFDRKYTLQIGDAGTGDGLTISDLQVTFRVKKSIDNKKKIDKAVISVYNLSMDSLAFLETEYPVVVLSCGYGDEIVRLFYGELFEFETKKQGTDRVTKIEVTPSFTDLTHNLMAELVPENGTVQDAIEAIRRNTKLSKGVYKGAALNQKIIYGYPLSGTPREMIDQVCDAYKLQWRIEGQALYINDYESVENEIQEIAPVFSPTSGLIDIPYFFTGVEGKSKKDKEKKRGIKFKALLNPNVYPGTIVRVDFNDSSEYYKVEEVEFSGDYRGQDWYMVCTCSIRPEA